MRVSFANVRLDEDLHMITMTYWFLICKSWDAEYFVVIREMTVAKEAEGNDIYEKESRSCKLEA